MGDFDAQTRRISSLLEGEEVKETMSFLDKELNYNRAIN